MFSDTLSIIKVWVVNICAILFSLADIEPLLRIIALISASIFSILQIIKFFRDWKKNKKNEQ